LNTLTGEARKRWLLGIERGREPWCVQWKEAAGWHPVHNPRGEKARRRQE